MNSKKVIVCDLDGTLAVSKSPLSKDMAEVLGHLLKRHYIAIVSGGTYSQFQKQFLSEFHCDPQLLQNLSLFPTMGSTCYTYDKEKNVWNQIYDEQIPESDRKKIIKALEEALEESGVDVTGARGPIIEDRKSQITFSGQGQIAPISLKEVWDPNQEKRRKIIDKLNKKISGFEIKIGGATSIDITKKGIDKAYAIGKIKQLLGVKDDDIIFIGDALYKGGNDASVKNTGVDFIQQDGPNETLELLSRYM
ncbi:MAG: HAD-IIB family hydrolase [Parcubacteria group bacterium]